MELLYEGASRSILCSANRQDDKDITFFIPAATTMKDYLLHCVPITSTLLDLLERDGRDEMVADVGADDIIAEIDID